MSNPESQIKASSPQQWLAFRKAFLENKLIDPRVAVLQYVRHFPTDVAMIVQAAAFEPQYRQYFDQFLPQIPSVELFERAAALTGESVAVSFLGRCGSDPISSRPLQEQVASIYGADSAAVFFALNSCEVHVEAESAEAKEAVQIIGKQLQINKALRKQHFRNVQQQFEPELEQVTTDQHKTANRNFCNLFEMEEAMDLRNMYLPAFARQLRLIRILEMHYVYAPSREAFIRLFTFLTDCYEEQPEDLDVDAIISEKFGAKTCLNKMFSHVKQNSLPSGSREKLLLFYQQVASNVLFVPFPTETDPNQIAERLVDGHQLHQTFTELRPLHVFDQMRVFVHIKRRLTYNLNKTEEEQLLKTLTDLFEDTATLLLENRFCYQLLTAYFECAVFLVKMLKQQKFGFVIDRMLKTLLADQTSLLQTGREIAVLNNVIKALQAQAVKPNKRPKFDQQLSMFLQRNGFELFANQEDIGRETEQVDEESEETKTGRTRDRLGFIVGCVKRKLQEEPRVDVVGANTYYPKLGRAGCEVEQRRRGLFQVLAGLIGQ